MIRCTRATKGHWGVIVGLMATYIPFVLYTPPSAFGYIAPEVPWISLRIGMQLAWLVPLIPNWRWNARITWNGRYFLIGFLGGGGWLVLMELAFLVLREPGPYSLPFSSRIAVLLSCLYFALTSALFSLRARTARQAILIGILCLVGQAIVSFFLLGSYFIAL